MTGSSTSPSQYAVNIQLSAGAFNDGSMVAAGVPEQPNDPQARCHMTTPITKVKERCLGCFLRVQRAASHASWPCRRRPMPRHLVEIPDWLSVTSIAWAIRSFASPPVGPLTRADVPPTGRAGRMSGPAGLPSGSHALSGRRTSPFDHRPRRFAIARRGRPELRGTCRRSGGFLV